MTRLDVAARLAEGRSAVEHTQRYVCAAHLLGYQHPDLTGHDRQVCEGYDDEAGLELRVLDGDCAVLRAVAAAAEESLRLAGARLTELAAAWAGPGADAATQFLQRHCDAAATVTAGVRAAAQGCELLRDSLWRLIDAKVATVVAIDDRCSAQRSEWLAAAAAVTSGAERSPIADDVVSSQIKPYVAGDIATDWLTARAATRAAVAAAYEAAVDAVTAAPAARFEIPGDLGPRFEPGPRDLPGADAPASPVAATARRIADAPAEQLIPDLPLADLLGTARDAALAAPLSGSPADSGPSSGAASPGLADLGRLFTDALGGLFGTPGLDDSAFDGPDPGRDADHDHGTDDEDGTDDHDGEDDTDEEDHNDDRDDDDGEDAKDDHNDDPAADRGDDENTGDAGQPSADREPQPADAADDQVIAAPPPESEPVPPAAQGPGDPV